MVAIGVWEIYKAKWDPTKVFYDIINASQMHSIVCKTVLFLVLINMYLIPDLKHYIFSTPKLSKNLPKKFSFSIIKNEFQHPKHQTTLNSMPNQFTLRDHP